MKAHDRHALRERALRMFTIAKEDARRANEYRALARQKRMNRALARSALSEALTLLVRAKAIVAGALDDVLPHYHDGHLDALARTTLDRAMAHPGWARLEGGR